MPPQVSWDSRTHSSGPPASPERAAFLQMEVGTARPLVARVEACSFPRTLALPAGLRAAALAASLGAGLCSGRVEQAEEPSLR